MFGGCGVWPLHSAVSQVGMLGSYIFFGRLRQRACVIRFKGMHIESELNKR